MLRKHELGSTCDRRPLATIDMDRKLGAMPLFLGELGRHVTQCLLAEAYIRTMWHLDPSSRLAIIEMGRKLGRAVFFLGELGPL